MRTAAARIRFDAPLRSCAAAPGLFESVLLGACSTVDRFVLERFIRRRPVAPVAGLPARVRRAIRFYANPRFVSEPETFFRPPNPPTVWPGTRLPLPGGELVSLDYETDFVPAFPDARNDSLEAWSRRGTALWWRHREPGRPVMLCVHGYGGGRTWLESLAFDAARFYYGGVDVVIYVLPYHGTRTPAGARHSGEAFFDMDLVRTNEAFGRAIYELRALMRHLRAAGTGPVGAFGMSLGGYTVALLASLEPELAFAVSMIPIVSFVDRWWSEGEDDPWLAIALAQGWTRAAVTRVLRVHDPLARPVLVPHARRLIIGARGDAICTPQHADVLWRHWGQPRIHWYPGGHLLQLRRGAALRDVRELLRDEGLLSASTVGEEPALEEPAA
jgi:pimeloyl-ACP methyl ester carboxylesterase